LNLKDWLSVLDFGFYHCIRNRGRLIFSRLALGGFWQVREDEVLRCRLARPPDLDGGSSARERLQ